MIVREICLNVPNDCSPWEATCRQSTGKVLSLVALQVAVAVEAVTAAVDGAVAAVAKSLLMQPEEGFLLAAVALLCCVG